MTDRVPLYPGRVSLTPVSGNTYDMVMADQPIVVGTPLNKAALLGDSTASTFGLAGDPTVNDAFAWIAKYNTYCWARREASVVINKTNISANVTISIGTSGSDFPYSSSIDSDGNLVNPSTLHVSRDVSSASSIASHAPCYYLINDEIYYLPSGSTSGSTSSTVYYNSTQRNLVFEAAASVKAQNVVVTKTVSGAWSAVFSSNRSAYPDSGVSGGYEYRFGGVPFDELTRFPIVLTGSYIGTGTYGSANKNEIQLDFAPRMLIVQPSNGAINIVRGGIPWVSGSKGYISQIKLSGSEMYNDTVSVTWGKTVSWYGSSADGQLNTANTKYNWIAIC